MLWGVGKGGGGSFMITGHTMKNASGCGGGGGGGRFMITGHIRKNALGCGEGRWWKLYDNWTHHEECFGVWGGGTRFMITGHIRKNALGMGIIFI